MEQKNKQNSINEDKKQLREYLGQYYVNCIKKSHLERRLKNLRDEINHPITGYEYSPINYGGTNKVSDGVVSLVYRISEIETRLENQKKRTQKAFSKVMDIISLLEDDSTERMILELRFIECKDWAAVQKEVHISRRACFYYQSMALEKLIEFAEVKKILEK